MSNSCPSHPTPQDVNLDCFTNPAELDPFINDEKYPTTLREYATAKKAAITARLAGDSQKEQEAEALCNSLYPQIPENYQW